MSLSVFLAVLFAALLHATWNALVKGSADKLTATLSVVVGTTPFAVATLLVWGLPADASLGLALLSGCVHTAYMSFLFLAYRHGDLSHVYPLARGTAPLIVTLVSLVWLGVTLSMMELVAVAVIASGILSLSIGRHAASTNPSAGTGFALLTALCIAGYSLIDAAGAQHSGSPMAYFSLVTLINLLTFLPIALWRRPERLRHVLTRHRRQALIGGGASFAAYCIVLWCFTQAPVPLVTALRETGIVFALIIGVALFREPMNVRKLLASLATLIGMVLLRLARP